MNSKTMSKMHLYLTLFWAILAVPTVLWWHDSILWVGLISVYANIVGHWGAYQATRAEVKADEIEEETSQDH